jgi:hypothetical protein
MVTLVFVHGHFVPGHFVAVFSSLGHFCRLWQQQIPTPLDLGTTYEKDAFANTSSPFDSVATGLRTIQFVFTKVWWYYLDPWLFVGKSRNLFFLWPLGHI